MMDITRIQQSSCLNLREMLHIAATAGKKLNFIRMSKSFRAVRKINSEFISFVSLHLDHGAVFKYS